MSNFLIHLAALSLGGGAVALILMLTARFTHARYAAIHFKCSMFLSTTFDVNWSDAL